MKELSLKEITVQKVKDRILDTSNKLADAFIDKKLGATVDLSALKTLLGNLNNLLGKIQDGTIEL